MITQEKYDAAVDKIVKVGLQGGNKNHYLKLGYKIKRKNGKNYFPVDLKSLSSGSNIKILVKCSTCKNTRLISFAAYYRAKNSLCESCNRRITGKASAKNIINVKFTRLTALETTSKRCNSHIIWKCLCDCGNICEVSICDLTSGATKSCGCLNKEKAKKSMTDLHRNDGCFIKEDHTKEEVLEHLKKQSEISKKQANFNKQVAKDRNYLCYFTCENEWGNIAVHHMQGRQDYSDLTYELSNLVCLRKDIHKEFHKMYTNYHNHVGQFYEFLTLYARN